MAQITETTRKKGMSINIAAAQSPENSSSNSGRVLSSPRTLGSSSTSAVGTGTGSGITNRARNDSGDPNQRTVQFKVNIEALNVTERLRFLAIVKVARAKELLIHNICDAHGGLPGAADKWLFMNGSGVWMQQDRTIGSYHPFILDEPLVLRPAPDTNTFLKATICVGEEVCYVGGETRVRGLLQLCNNKPTNSSTGVFAKLGGDWEATLLDDNAIVTSLDFTEEVKFEIKEREKLHEESGPLTPRSREAAQKEKETKDSKERAAVAAAVNAGPLTPRSRLSLGGLSQSLISALPLKKEDGSSTPRGSTTPRASHLERARTDSINLSLQQVTDKAGVITPGNTTPRGSLTPRSAANEEKKKGYFTVTPITYELISTRSRLSVSLALDPIKSLGHSVAGSLGSGRAEYRDINIIFADEAHSKVLMKFEMAQTVGEIVRRLCALKPIVYPNAAEYALYIISQQKWMKERKVLGKYILADHEEVELKKKDETHPEVLEALGEAAAKIKAELKAKRKKQKEEIRKRKEEEEKQNAELKKTQRSGSVKSFGKIKGPAIPTEPGIPLRLSVVQIGTTVVGLFRLSGTASNVRKLYKSFDKDPVSMEWVKDVHEIAEALKQFLRESPEPLLPNYAAFVAASDSADDTTKNDMFKKAIQSLPADRQLMLSLIFAYLYMIHLRASYNKMQASNIGVVFGPNIFGSADATDMNVVLKKNSIATSLVERAETLFPEHVAEFKVTEAQISTPSSPPTTPNRATSPLNLATPNTSSTNLSTSSETLEYTNTNAITTATTSTTNNGNQVESSIPNEVLQKVKLLKVRQISISHGKGEGKATSKTHTFKPSATLDEAFSFIRYEQVRNCTLVFENNSAMGFADGQFLEFDDFNDDE